MSKTRPDQFPNYSSVPLPSLRPDSRRILLEYQPKCVFNLPNAISALPNTSKNIENHSKNSTA